MSKNTKNLSKEKFAAEGYNISIQGKNVQVTDSIRDYIFEKLNKVERFTSNIIDVHVALDIQKLSHTVTIVMKFLHFNIQVHATTGDLYASIDAASTKLITLIRKYKDKLQGHRAKDLTSIDMKVHVVTSLGETEEINDEIEEENLKEEEKKYKMPKVVAKEAIPLKILTQEEAVMKLELSGDLFLIYRGEEDQKLKVMYKRKDENLGIIAVE
jgi:putative sigma-54 modulation protein